MNFFERQRQVRSQSGRLVLLFALAVLGILLAVNAAVVLALRFTSQEQVAEAGGVLALVAQRPGLLVGVSLLTLAVIGLSSLGKMASLRSGGGKVARELGGVPVPEDTRDPHLRRLRNVVEEIAIAASVPVPEVYVLDGEEGINAFAAGWSPSDAAVAVTRGALERLNRDELQGVIAHEFSHILNGDMRLNIRLMGVLFGILVLGIIGQRVLIYGRGGRGKDGSAVLLVALAVMIVGYVGVFFGRMIKAGISRQREYLADASAVQFTRQTTGLAGALKKIAGAPSGSRLAAAEAEEVSHMLFGDGVGYSALFATHPPLAARIRALDPQFDPAQLPALAQRHAAAPPDGLEEDRAMGLAEGMPGTALPASASEIALVPGRVRDQVAEPGHDDYRRAGALVKAIAPELRAAAASHEGSVALVLGLLLDPRTEVRMAQRRAIEASLGPAAAGHAESAAEATRGLHPLLRLPLLDLAFPVLRRRPRAELERLVGCVQALVHADGRVGLFEYCLGVLLQRQVVESLDPSRYRPGGRRKLARSADALADLLSTLAAHGHADEDGARRAFAAGMQCALPQVARSYRPPGDWRAALDRALPQLDALDPGGKSLVLEAMVVASSHDGRVSVAEAELLRTMSAYLHLPLPPLLTDLGEAG